MNNHISSTLAKRYLTACLTAVFSIISAMTAGATQKEFSGATNGSWHDAENWTPEGVPAAADDVIISAKTVNATNIVANSLSLSGATLNVGNSSDRPAIAVSVAGDVALTGASRLYVYAPELADWTIFSTCYSDYSTLYPVLWNAAIRFNIGGDFSVSDTSVVYPDAAPITGVPVFFKVAGDFSLADGASFDAVSRGWGWSEGVTEDAPAGAKRRHKENTVQTWGWTFAPGAGLNWNTAARYGGSSSGTTWDGKPYGKSYGYQYAPFLPGSPGGLYQSGNLYKPYRGSGEIVIFTKKKATVNGQLIAGAKPKRDHSGDSGGGIWLTAETFSLGTNAAALAIGRDTGGPYATGGGGRVCLAEGLTDDDIIASFAAGTLPDGYTPAEFVDEIAVDVHGGQKGDSYGTLGSAWFIRSATTKVKVEVTISGSGSVTVGGETYSEDFDLMVDPNTDISFIATPAQDWRFNYWIGSKLPGGNSDQASIVVSTDVPTTLTVQFLTGVVDKLWIGAANASWDNPANWAPAGVPGQYDAVYMTNATTTLTHPIHLGKLVIAGNSKVAFAALPLEGNSDFTNLYANATVVRIDDSIEVSGTAVLTLQNDKKTGTPVKIETGDFLIGSTAKVSADGTGFGWTIGEDEYKVVTSGANRTRGPGTGSSWTVGASYGNWGNGNTTRGPYGYKYAPFMPGSPNGAYNGIDNARTGGGTVWLDCSGKIVINGAISAKGGESDAYYGSASGGGIWICATAIEAASTGSVKAEGGYQVTYGYYGSVGSGGRISFGIGLSAAEKAALAAGEEPASLTYYDTIDIMNASALGGTEKRVTPITGKSGTCTTVIGSAAKFEVKVSSSPLAATGVDPAYALYSFDQNTERTFTAPQYGYDPSDASIRYSLAGYVVSNANGFVKSGDSGSVSVTLENSPVSVTWLWDSRESKITVAKPVNGAITVDGIGQAGDVELWYGGTSPSIGVTVDDGYEFVNWNGPLPKDCWTKNPLVITGELSTEITPVIRRIEEPATRQWNATGEWTDPSKWTPAGNIPGAGDTVVIKGKTCTIPDYAICSDLIVEGGTLKIGADVNKANHPKLVVTHNFTMTNSAAVNIYGGPVVEDYTFVSGAAFIEVGGEFLITGNSVYSPYSQYLTGGSAIVTADRFTVTTNATVNANEKGYYWLNGVQPYTVGVGCAYVSGGAYGNNATTHTGGGGYMYGQEYAPIHPGSANGDYGTPSRPGGLIRVHARVMSLAGNFLANSFVNSQFGGPSGGGIWLTAKKLDFVPGAVFSANGGNSNYNSRGTGGRISFTQGANEKCLAELSETGTYTGFRQSRVTTFDTFTNKYSRVTVEVLGGGGFNKTNHDGPNGTFNLLNAAPKGFKLLLR